MVLQTLGSLGPLHGYAIAARLEQVSAGALQLNMGTLYPALMRLEQRGFCAVTGAPRAQPQSAVLLAHLRRTPQLAKEKRPGTAWLASCTRCSAAKGETRSQAMSTFREWMQRVLGTMRRGRPDGDLEEELRLRSEMAEDDARASGAVRAARSGWAALLRRWRPCAISAACPGSTRSSRRRLRLASVRRHRAASRRGVFARTGHRRDDCGVPSRGRRPASAAAGRRSRSLVRRRQDAPRHRRIGLRGRFRLPDLPHVFRASAGTQTAAGRPAAPQPVTFGESGDPESALRQYLSGNAFATLGLQPPRPPARAERRRVTRRPSGRRPELRLLDAVVSIALPE